MRELILTSIVRDSVRERKAKEMSKNIGLERNARLLCANRCHGVREERGSLHQIRFAAIGTSCWYCNTNRCHVVRNH